MRIATKLKLAVWIPALVALVVFTALLFSHKVLENINENRVVARQVINGMHDLTALAYTYLLYHEERPKQQFMLQYDALNERIAIARLGNPEQQAHMEGIYRAINSMGREFANLVSEYESFGSTEQSALYAEAKERLAAQILIRAHEGKSHAEQLKRLIDQENTTIQNRIDLLILLFIAFTTLPLIFVLKRMMNRIGSSLATLRKGTEVVASGNLNHRIGLSSQDEIGDLGRAFDLMTLQLHDTTVSKEALSREVQERKRVQEDLRREQERLRVTLGSIGDAVIATDASGKVSFLNAVAATLTEWPPEAAMGQPIRKIFKTINEKTGESGEDIVQKVIDNKAVVMLANNTALITRNGREIPIEDSAAPIRDSDGRTVGVVLVFHDVTVRRRDQDALRASEARYRQLNEALEEKIRGRTAALAQTVDTLQAEIEQRKRAEAELMRANAQLAIRAKQLRALAGELTAAEQRERKRVSKLLHDGLQQDLAIAKMQAGGLSELLNRSPFKQNADEIEKSIAKAIDMSRSLSADLSPPVLYASGLAAGLEWLARRMREMHGFEVDLHIDNRIELPEDVKILVFESVRELLFNAVKHAQVSRAQVHMQHFEETGIRIIVRDEGAGFDPCRLKVYGDQGGGFGLFSIGERIGLLGGTFDMDSDPGKGSRFTLTVPCPSKPAPQDANSTLALVAPCESETIPDLRKESTIRVLIADDHALFRDSVARFVDNESDISSIAQAGNGREAIELARKFKPDVILMDINMPEISGLEATLTIHAELPNIRIIGLSMHEDHECAQSMYAAGAIGYKSKSCSASELVTAIREAML